MERSVRQLVGPSYPPGQTIDRTLLCVRHADLRRWAALYFPDDRPSFLFGEYENPRLDVSLGAHLCLQADKDYAERELNFVRKEYEKLAATLEAKTIECHVYIQRLTEQEPRSEQGTAVKNRMIAALLQLLLGSSSSGQKLSRFTSQAAIVEELLTRYPDVAGLSKRSLDRHFAEANRSLYPKA